MLLVSQPPQEPAAEVGGENRDYDNRYKQACQSMLILLQYRSLRKYPSLPHLAPAPASFSLFFSLSRDVPCLGMIIAAVAGFQDKQGGERICDERQWSAFLYRDVKS